MKFCCCFMMPGLVHRSSRPSDQSSGPISDCCQQGGLLPHLHRHRDGVDYRQLSRYWNGLSSTARRDLLRIDKQSLFEQVRKNSYCSRCNGLLSEAFSQLANYSKSHQGGSSSYVRHVHGCSNAHFDKRGCISRIYSEDDIRDPSVHPWGGLTATRDGTLTLLDSFLDGQPLEMIQNVCDCARAREREHELLYPDACGGGGRGWISQSIGSFGSGRGHSVKETCALHTARLSCDALVDFWSALGEEARRSLLRMKEEDFISRLLLRFEKKRFCRDCRRNVLKELKELKELKRSRKEPKCTRWFCNADTAFQYEVSNTSVNVKWKEWVGGGFESTYQYFEWALGSAEGSADILGFEHVGCSEGASVEGLDLSQISQVYIILRGWKHDGRCTEVSVKAHGLKDKQCVHQRLLVGDGYVTMMTKGESIKKLFEHAEEAEEEENDDEMDNSGSELENEVRGQKHAKSPELAREFLLDAATVIFKEQVEKAFREGTARQNAHSIFVSLALNLLEERIYVAYKEISTLEKQRQLLEEEAHERRENQQRREMKRLKEREKKLRRKEKQREREHDKEKSKNELQLLHDTATDCDSGVTSLLGEIEETHAEDVIKESESIANGGMGNDRPPDALQPSTLEPMEILDCRNFRREALDHVDLSMPMDNFEEPSTADRKRSFFLERSKTNRRRSRRRKGPFMEVISRRFIRESSITSLNARNGLQGCTKLSCSSLRETSEVVTEQVFVSSQKFCGGFGKRLRNIKSNYVEGWNNGRLQERQNGFLLQSSSKRTSYISSTQNAGTGWVEKEYFPLKSSRRKNSVDLCNQKVTRTGSFVSGSSQCSWQVMKTIPAGHDKRELQDQDAPVDSEVILSNSSFEFEKMIETDCKESISAGADSLVNTNQHDACDRVSFRRSAGGFVEKNQHNMQVGCADRGHAESLAFATSDSPAFVEALKPLSRVMAVLTEESLDDDASISSAISCVTDSGDGGTSCCSRTESPKFCSGRSSNEASSAELPVSVPAEHEAHKREPMQQGIDNKTLGKDCNNALNHDTPQPASAVERFTHPEYYSYSSASETPTYSHNYTHGYEHMQVSVNPEVPIFDGTPHMCHNSALLLPLLPASLMPMHMPQSLGSPWVPTPCMAQPVMNTGLMPLSHSPERFYMDCFRQSIGDMQALLLPVQHPFQPLSHIMGLSVMPTTFMHQNFTPWGEQQWIEPLPVRNAFEEKRPLIDSLTDKHSSAFSTSQDAALPTNFPTNDPLEFSLFHFGSLSTDEELTILSQREEGRRGAFKSLDLSCSRASQQESAAVPKSSLPEYSLFAAKPSSRFGFF